MLAAWLRIFERINLILRNHDTGRQFTYALLNSAWSICQLLTAFI